MCHSVSTGENLSTDLEDQKTFSLNKKLVNLFPASVSSVYFVSGKQVSGRMEICC